MRSIVEITINYFHFFSLMLSLPCYKVVPEDPKEAYVKLSKTLTSNYYAIMITAIQRLVMKSTNRAYYLSMHGYIYFI